MAVNLGDDADTTTAVYGQIAGVFYVKDNILKKWHKRITIKVTILYFNFLTRMMNT